MINEPYKLGDRTYDWKDIQDLGGSDEAEPPKELEECLLSPAEIRHLVYITIKDFDVAVRKGCEKQLASPKLKAYIEAQVDKALSINHWDTEATTFEAGRNTGKDEERERIFDLIKKYLAHMITLQELEDKIQQEK